MSDYESSITDESLADMLQTVKERGVLGLKYTFTTVMKDFTGFHDTNIESYLKAYFEKVEPDLLEPEHRMNANITAYLLEDSERIRNFFEWVAAEKLAESPEYKLSDINAPPYNN